MFKFVMKLYADRDSEIKQKALNLSILLVLLLSIVLFILIYDFITWDEKNLLSETLSYGLVLVAGYQFLKARFLMASSLCIIAMMVILEVSLFSSEDLLPGRIYIAAYYMLAIQVIVFFVAPKSYFLLVSGAIGIISIVVLYIILRNVLDPQAQQELLNGFLVSMGIYSGSYVVFYSISRSYSIIFNNVREEGRKSLKQLTKITNIVSTSEQAIENTKDLENHFVHAFRALQGLVVELKAFRDRLSNLDINLDGSNQSISRITNAVQKFNQLITEQSAAIEEASASVNEMVTSLDSVHQITQKRLSSTRILIETSKQGSSHLDNTNKAFGSVNLAMEKIMDVNNLIQDIADKTNLLGMNASIEAAHAGEKGKGFAVVAGEIRKLAESAAKNSRMISAHITELIQSFEGAEYNIKSTSSIYQKVFEETGELSDSLEEIGESTTQLNMGGNQILSGISVITESSTTIHRESHEIEENQKQIQDSVNETKELSSNLRKTLDNSIMAILDIEMAMKTIKESIHHNQEITRKMHDSINALKEDHKSDNENDEKNYGISEKTHENTGMRLYKEGSETQEKSLISEYEETRIKLKKD